MDKDTVGTASEVSDAARRAVDKAAAYAADGLARGSAAALDQANEALHGVRGAFDRASHSLREYGRAGEQWVEERAVELGKELRGQGGRAMEGLCRQVEQNPLTSIAIAFALGIVCTMIARR
jgi:ElaB/YqjD/DUF883 family membrane-anchored ribosome-binding protein